MGAPVVFRIVTNSERSAFGCQRRWWFSYIEGLDPWRTPAPLLHGSLVHQMLATWYRSNFGLTTAAILELVVEPWLEMRFARADAMEPNVGGIEKQKDLETSALATAMFLGYQNHWIGPDSKYLDVVAVEPQMARWLRHPDKGTPIYDFVKHGDKRRRRRWAYGGGVDLLFTDRRDERIWAMEHKNTSERDLLVFLRKALDFSPQTRGYAWALEDPIPEISDIKDPVVVAGVVYNALRKKIPTPVKPLKSGKISRDKRIDTTADIYRAAIIANGENVDTFSSELARLKNNLFFAREGVTFSRNEIEDFERDMTESALQIRAASKLNVYQPRQFSMCQGGTYAKCPFQDLCLDDGEWARDDFGVKGIRHVELRGDMAEPWAAQERGLTLADADQAQSAVPDDGQHIIRGAVIDFEADPVNSIID